MAATILAIAMAAAVFAPAMSMLRPRWSLHSRAFVAPISALFWWSAKSSTIFRPSTLPPKSAIAIFVASTPPTPPSSEYTPCRSSMSPMTTSSAAASAGGAPPVIAVSAAVRQIPHSVRFMTASQDVELSSLFFLANLWRAMTRRFARGRLFRGVVVGGWAWKSTVRTPYSPGVVRDAPLEIRANSSQALAVL